MSKKWIAGTLMLGCLLLNPAWAEKPAAWVDSIDGAKKVYKHYKGDPEGTWYRAYVEMNGLVLDSFKTNKDSLASLRFYLGSRANLDKGSRIRIVNERNVVFLDKGSMWSYFDPKLRGKKKPITIQTAGGVMAIKGTEFVVDVRGEGSQAVTEVSVLSGRVEVMPSESGSAPSSFAGQGMTVKFDRYGITESLSKSIDEQERYLKEKYADLYALRQLLFETREVASLLRYQKVRLTAQEKETDNKLRRAHWLATGRDVGPGDVGSADTSNIDAMLAEFDAKMAGKTGTGESETGSQTDLTALLNGGAAPTGPTVPKFDWGWMDGTRFAFLILDAQDDEQVYWIEKTEAKSFEYPSDARPLSPGNYRYRVIPLDDAGNPSGRPTEDTFSVANP